jgi:hypothetical protein
MLELLKQIFIKLKKEGFTGEIVIRVQLNDGGVRTFKTYRENLLDL